MEEMRKRFDEIMCYRTAMHSLSCEECPCYQRCKSLPEEDYTCEDMFFAYITLGKNFDLKKNSKNS
jgi:hypothetical protein